MSFSLGLLSETVMYNDPGLLFKGKLDCTARLTSYELMITSGKNNNYYTCVCLLNSTVDRFADCFAV